MKVIIAGGRTGRLTELDFEFLDGIEISEVVSGGAKGIDLCGELYASSRGLPKKRFPADWSKHGRAAGPIRNAEMANYADGLAAFKGGIGTKSMINEATKAGLIIYSTPS